MRQPLIETNLWSGVSFQADADSTRWLIESSLQRVAVPTDRLIRVEFRDRGFVQVAGSVLGGVYVGSRVAAIGLVASWLLAPKHECPPPDSDQPCWTTPRVSAGRVGFVLGCAGGFWAGMARPGKVVYVFRE